MGVKYEHIGTVVVTRTLLHTYKCGAVVQLAGIDGINTVIPHSVLSIYCLGTSMVNDICTCKSLSVDIHYLVNIQAVCPLLDLPGQWPRPTLSHCQPPNTVPVHVPMQAHTT